MEMYSYTDPQKLKSFLDEVVDTINHLDFIELDPISVPHRYTLSQDIEIAGFFSAILAWGNRKTIINKSLELMSLMDHSPYQFILEHTDRDLKQIQNFVHRTFQATDLLYFIDFLHRHYHQCQSLEQAFYPDNGKPYNQKEALIHFHSYFFSHESAPTRTKKHISTPLNHSTCKRLNMFLRWMVRSDYRKVDFGLWKTIPTSQLMIPLDVHVAHYATKFGLLTRSKKDWTAVEEITSALVKLDPIDPIKYDFALFGLGVQSKKKAIFLV